MISDGPEFDFDMKDIDRIRKEMKVWIKRLHVIYKQWKSEKDRDEREARKASLEEANGATNRASQQTTESSTCDVVSPPKASGQIRETKGQKDPVPQSELNGNESNKTFESEPSGQQGSERVVAQSGGGRDKPLPQTDGAGISNMAQFMSSKHFASPGTSSETAPEKTLESSEVSDEAVVTHTITALSALAVDEGSPSRRDKEQGHSSPTSIQRDVL